MLRHLGFRGRLFLIFGGIVITLTSLGFSVYFFHEDAKNFAFEHFPLPAQAAAIVTLIEEGEEDRLELILRAVNSERFSVTIENSTPSPRSITRRMPVVELFMTQYVEMFPGRQIWALFGNETSLGFWEQLFERLNQKTKVPIALFVELENGDFVKIQLRGDSSARILSVPLAIVLSFASCLVAAIAIWAILRESRPLNAISVSVGGFSEDGVPRLVQPSGAPEFKKLAFAMNAMQERISGLLKGRTMLLGAMGHDLKTYVTRLRLRTELMEENEYRKQSIVDLEDMGELIDSALTVARGALGPTNKQLVDLSDLIKQEASRYEADEFGISLEGVDIEVSILGDEIALRSLLSNLLENAKRYASFCLVRLVCDPEHAILAIEDDGPGIAEEFRKEIFEPFFRLDAARNMSKAGSGLGLSIVKQIADAHGADINVSDASLGGTCFQVTFPLTHQGRDE